MQEGVQSQVSEHDALGVKNGKIIWLGSSAQIAQDLKANREKSRDCGGKLVTPGLIDCHTHMVYAGHRAIEFEQLLEGRSYAEIAAAGGGIQSTVNATRAASHDELFNSSAQRLKQFLAEGVTTVEIKSGYGLELETEIKMLEVARNLGSAFPVNVKTTFLGAHAIPGDYSGGADAYINYVCEVMLPEAHAHGLVDAVDAFCEHIAFTPQQTAKVFAKAQQLGLPVKLHAEQLSDSGGARMAAEKHALSVDHLEYLAAEDAPCLAKSGTVAVLLPGAFYFLGETQLPPVQALREHEVKMAVASDANPGSSPTRSLLLMLNMACSLFKLTPMEALAGVTCHAATALGMQDQIGEISIGKQADMVLWDVQDSAELCYWLGGNPCLASMHNGVTRGVITAKSSGVSTGAQHGA